VAVLAEIDIVPSTKYLFPATHEDLSSSTETVATAAAMTILTFPSLNFY
jgi:hypothetical protein